MIKGKWGRPISKGEAAALSLAISNNGIIASNNLKDVKNIAKQKKYSDDDFVNYSYSIV